MTARATFSRWLRLRCTALADAEVTQLSLLGGADVAAVVLIAKQALTGCYIGESPVG